MTTLSAIVLIGIPASGKSTFYQQHFKLTHLQISLDQLKSRYRESLLLDSTCRQGLPFVSDNTNATRSERSRIIAPAKAAGYRVVGYYFSSKLAEALRRNRKRQGAARIPDPGVRGIAGRLELPRGDEGFDELWYVRMDDSGGFVVQPWLEEDEPGGDGADLTSVVKSGRKGI